MLYNVFTDNETEREMIATYLKTFFPAGSDKSETVRESFTSSQAESIGSACYKEGVNPATAEKLVQKWNRQSRVSGSKTTYAL